MKTDLEIVRLGDVAEFVRGINFKPDDVVPPGTPGSVDCMRTKNVQNELDQSDVWAVGERFVKREDQFMETGDILVSSANSWNLVGKCCWIPKLPRRTSFGGFVSVLRPHRIKVDPRFLFRWFSSDRIQTTVRSFGQQTTNISNLNTERCLALQFPIPSLSEQKRIAAVLDQADVLRTKRRAAIAQLDELTQSIFLEMFGHSIKEDWKTTDISAITDTAGGAIRTGPFGSQLLHSEFTDSGIAVLGIDNVVANEFRWAERRFISPVKYRQLERYTVHPGDVLITIMGTCGRCAVVPDDICLAINTKHLCCITLDKSKCLPKFLHAYFLQHPIALQYMSQTAKGAIMSGLNMGIIKKMPIQLPPISLQRDFAKRIASIEKLKATHQTSLAELDALFASLQHRAFRGEL